MIEAGDRDPEKIKAFLKCAVLSTRRELREYTTGPDAPAPDYAGLCIKATRIFIQKIRRVCDAKNILVEFRTIHGELRHYPGFISKQWPAQHQYCSVELLGHKFYVDCTCGQFRPLNSRIPDYYISERPPKWFLPDGKNPAYRGWTKRLNDKILIRYDETINGVARKRTEGVIEYTQYSIWGPVSDIIRKALGL